MRHIISGVGDAADGTEAGLVLGRALADLFLMLWSVGNAVMPFILGAAAAYLLDPVADRLEGWACRARWRWWSSQSRPS